MNSKVHDYTRQVRVLLRNLRYSRLLGRRRQQMAIQSALTQVYLVTNRFLHHLHIDYWLVYGTLLGWHRTGEIIPGDRDVDFGAHERHYTQIWAARSALPPGFRMFDTSHRHDGPKLYVVHRGWEADIYFYKDANDRLQSYERSNNLGDMQPFPKGFVYPLRPATFLGEATYVPQDALSYLEHTYGYIGFDAVKDPKTGYWHQRSS